jgi:hypothetical protein
MPGCTGFTHDKQKEIRHEGQVVSSIMLRSTGVPRYHAVLHAAFGHVKYALRLSSIET